MSTPKPPRNAAATRRRFDPSFKHEAVALARKLGFKQAAADLGNNEGNLRNWLHAVERHGATALASPEERGDVEVELRRLKEENRILRMERDILKKKRRRSSQRKTDEIPFRCGERRRLACYRAVSHTGGVHIRLLRMAPQAEDRT